MNTEVEKSREGSIEERTDASIELIVFSDDWGRHPSSSQHLIRHLLPYYPVTWVNTVGTRPPRLDMLTVRRGLEKLRGWFGGGVAEQVGDDGGPVVVNPVMWPAFGRRFGRPLNRFLLTRACSALPRTSPRRIAITTVPIVADLVGRLPVDRWIYYCVDNLAEWPGLDRASLEPMEVDLVARADHVVAVSDTLIERMARLGRAASLLTHGVDLEHWSEHESGGVEDLAALPKPWIVFWGLIDRRLDLSSLKAVIGRLERGTLILVGPENNPHPELAKLPRTVCPGPWSYNRLPALAHESDVLIMPYGDSPATRAIQPLKLKEYLATGKPTIVSTIPAALEWRDACDVASSPEEFANLVFERLSSGLPVSQGAARQRLSEESWATKAEVFRNSLLADG